VLIIVQNLPVPFDRRVWLESLALTAAGFDVAVVCPKAPGDPSYEVVDGVRLYKYRPYRASGRAIGFVGEYLYSFVATARHALKAWRDRPFEVMQACNPPDIFWPLALLFRVLGRVRFVFDHHDLCPELYESRFPTAPRAPYWGLRALEWATFRSADEVTSTNDSYRQVAIDRGGKRPDQVTVVRTGPDPQRLQRGAEDAALRRGRRHLVAYIGVMGPQDGVDIVIRAAARIVHELGRTDISFTLIGSGDCYDELVALRDALDLGDYVEFTGRAPDELVGRIMSTAVIGLSPDPKNPLNDVSTMNKTMEYMAFELPVVAFDLRETRVSAGAAAVYVEPNREDRYADAIVDLLADADQRREMGAFGRTRVEDELAWTYQRGRYVEVFRRLAAAKAGRRPQLVARAAERP
jgi:glycosyltransferase involved in cell wall biosynthesis